MINKPHKPCVHWITLAPSSGEQGKLLFGLCCCIWLLIILMLFFGETNVPRGCKVLRANGQMALSIVKWVTTESNVFKKSNTCSVFPGNGIYWVLKVRHGLVAQVEVIVSGFIHQVTTVQVSSDHLFFCHSSGQELYWQQGETHLRDDNPQWDYFIRVQSVKKNIHT